MLRDSVLVVVVVVRTRPRAIPLAMITIRKSFMSFLFFPVMTMGLRLAALQAAGAPLISSFLENGFEKKRAKKSRRFDLSEAIFK